MASEPLNILCLDGGGVRGLTSLLILRSLMEQLKIASKMQTEPLPCEVFDLICGTSTGGLTALMLGRLRMSVGDAIESYLQFSQTVFEEKKFGLLQDASKLVHTLFGHKDKDLAMYDASKLKEWVIDTTTKALGDGRASLKDPGDGTDKCCRTFVVAVSADYADAPPIIFRTFSTKTHHADTCKIWEAARATTAAFPFFEPVSFGSPPQSYRDGLYSGANNPSKLAIDEVHAIFPSRKIGCFLSLGTGVPDVVSLRGPDKLAEACMALIQTCERVHDDTVKTFREGKHGEPYFRFSVPRGIGKIEIDEWNRVQEMAGITSGYMRLYEEEVKATKCVAAMGPKAKEIARKIEEGMTLQ